LSGNLEVSELKEVRAALLRFEIWLEVDCQTRQNAFPSVDSCSFRKIGLMIFRISEAVLSFAFNY